MKTITIIATALSGLVASTAIAAPAESRKPGADTTAAEVAPTGVDSKSYCLKQTPTGSRIARKLCQSRAQWAAQGVNVDDAR